MKIDLHVHTKYSRDSLNTLNALRKVCKKKGLEITVTDHNEIKGALKFKPKIIGEEIKTKDGEVIGLFLNEKIRKGLSVEETVDLIREQGAIIMIPHPFDRLRKSRLKKAITPEIVEVCNSRTLIKQDNAKAWELAKKLNVLKAVGSDAHFPFEVGSAYVEMDDFNSPKEFLKNLKTAKLFCRSSGILGHCLSKAFKWIK